MKQITVLALAAGLSWMPLGQAQDTASAEALIKKNGCLKCHSVSADKDGPSFKKTAAKYKGQADAAAKLEKFLAAGGKHPKIKADEAQTKNVVAYVLSR